MAIQIKSDGSFSVEYEGFSGGLNVEEPETLISDKESPAFNNFMLRNKELRSRPKLTAFPSAGIGNSVLGQTTFLDANGTYHLVAWAGGTLYQYNPTLLDWPTVGAAGPGNMDPNPVSYRAFANKIYYTNVSFISRGPTPGGGGGGPIITPFVGYWDGITTAPVFTNTFGDGSISNSIAGISLTDSPTVGGGLPGGPTIIGPIAIGAGYLSELNNTLLLANVSIKDQGNGNIYRFPNLIWWSANGLPLQWDPTQNTSAGFNPFLDVADQITGLAMLGIAGYIFRNFGITQMTPTGSAATPWEFDHMWASEHGIGNIFPWSIAQYGPTCAFIAQDNVYSLSVTSAQPIGGLSRDAIMKDLANSTAIPFANIIPQLVNGFIYLTYQLFILLGTFVRVYLYSFEDKNWSTWDTTLNSITCAPNVV